MLFWVGIFRSFPLEASLWCTVCPSRWSRLPRMVRSTVIGFGLSYRVVFTYLFPFVLYIEGSRTFFCVYWVIMLLYFCFLFCCMRCSSNWSVCVIYLFIYLFIYFFIYNLFLLYLTNMFSVLSLIILTNFSFVLYSVWWGLVVLHSLFIGVLFLSFFLFVYLFT